ncbi:MAG: hypothetical protein M1823_001396 [Watsoniomyces obsoletus]|nr:MAG: hypothetical protein M1823_001396 [Watsoniomyces obsoletus]
MAQREVEIEVGDVVNVPGDMYGTVRFVGSVKGKAGVFAGVELSKEFAPRGKNDGDVDGVHYFRTSIPHSGIFLPVGRATKRGPVSSDSIPHTPTDMSSDVLVKPTRTPPTPSLAKLSQSVGPGRAASPMFKPKSRPSLPRPESPTRRQQQPMTTPATARPSLGVARAGVGTPRYAPSPTPGKMAGSTLKPKRHSNTFAGDPGRKTPATAVRPGSRAQIPRSESAMGSHEVGARSSQHSSYTSGKAYGGRDSHDNDVISLRQKLEQRDRQLKEQAGQLAEMESSLAEVQSLMNVNQASNSGKVNEDVGGAADAVQLRALLREKNEKITMLTAEFDAHRADFRSTIDTLEMASTETERVYEKRVEELLQHVRELQDRSEDVNIVARQLKQLEELVQELEEGLEDARRGEAEARSEVEFLRGEVERGRSELRREREKAAAAMKGVTSPVVVNGGGGGSSFEGVTTKEVEQRDDEIRGLKAIIHSLSRDSMPPPAAPTQMNGGSNNTNNRQRPISSGANNTTNDDRLPQELLEDRDRLEQEMLDLRGLVERKVHREGELEREIDRLRQNHVLRPNSHSTASASVGGGIYKPERQSGSSERTVVIPQQTQQPPDHPAAGPPSRSTPLETMHENERYHHHHQQDQDQFSSSEDHADTDTDSALWCEICDAGGHDILTCTNISGGGHPPRTSSNANVHALSTGFGGNETIPTPTQPQQRTGRDVVMHGLSSLNQSSKRGDDTYHNYHTTTTTMGNHKTTSSVSNFTPPPAKSLLVPDFTQQQGQSSTQVIESKTRMEEEGKEGGRTGMMDMGTDVDADMNMMVPGKASGVIDSNKWCALCERDGHDSVDCPLEEGL